MSRRWRVRSMIVLPAALLCGLLAGCFSSHGTKVRYEDPLTHESWECEFSELTASQLLGIRLQNAVIAFLGVHASQVGSVGTSQNSQADAHFWANIEGGGSMELTGTATLDGDNLTVNLNHDVDAAAASSPAQTGKSMQMNLTVTDDDISGDVTYNDGTNEYTGTVNLQPIPD